MKSTINDQECQHVTRRYESISIVLSKQTGWPISAQFYVQVIQKQQSQNFATDRREVEICDLCEPWRIVPQDKMGSRILRYSWFRTSDVSQYTQQDGE